METLRQRALRLLAQRDHARAELQRKLAPHADSEEALAVLLDELSARKLLSDARYAEMRVSARAMRYGNARLAQELRQKGVPDEVVTDALTAAGDEISRARTIWRRKFGKLPADAAEYARQMRHLLGKGFSGDVVRRILRDAAADEESANDTERGKEE